MWHLAKLYPIESTATFITALPIIAFLVRSAYNQKAVRFFFIYLVVKFSIEILMFYMASRVINNLYLGNLLTIASFCFISRMFIEMYESRVSRSVARTCIAVFFAVVACDIVRDGVEYTFRFSGMAECIFIMLFCMLYFHELVRHPKIPDLLKFPFFWVVAGLLIYFACCTFISPLAFYLDRWPVNHEMHVFVLIPYILETSYLSIISLGILVSKA